MIRELATYIEDNTSYTIGTDLFVGFRDEKSPDNCVVLLDIGGVPDEYLREKYTMLYQIVVRNKDYNQAYTSAGLLYDLFNKIFDVELESLSVSGQVYRIEVGDNMRVPYHLGTDAAGRHEFSMDIKFLVSEN